MSRNLRQSKILEIISTKEIETQEELVSSLRLCGFDITQATISRDIKELGLTKILSGNSSKYKYAVVENETKNNSNKFYSLFRECVVSVKTSTNFVIVKTLKGMGMSICGIVDKLNLDGYLGAVCGDDTVMIISSTEDDALDYTKSLSKLLDE